MTTLMTYNLTQYTDFRKLEFEYSKLKDENTDLIGKLATIEQIYQEQLKAFQAERKEWGITQVKLKVSVEQAKDKIDQIVLFSENIHSQIKNLERMGIDLGEQFQQTSCKDTTEQIKCIFNQTIKCLMITLNKNNDWALRHEKEIALFKNQTKQSKKHEHQLKMEIRYLAEEISKFQTINSSLMNEISMLKRENTDYKLQIHEMNRQNQENSLAQPQREDHIEDNNFALDLLNYQKQLLERIFAKLLSSLQNEALNQILTDMYASYEAVAEAYRQKLQIQYDLQDLEAQYKRQKNSKVTQNLLIELRKQIEDFRNQLHKQKQVLNKQQEQLQNHFLSLQSTDREDKKLRNYTVQIQKKLKEIRSYNETKRQSDDSAQPQSSRIQFRVTTKAEDVMKELVRRDRENIQKIFKETRSNYNKKFNL